MNSPVFHSRQMRKYVLITAAHDEQEFIEQTLRSVVAQTVQPQQWVIVSDGSTDGTDELVARYAAAHGFIRLVRCDIIKPRQRRSQTSVAWLIVDGGDRVDRIVGLVAYREELQVAHDFRT